MGSENANGLAQNADNGLGFGFLERYHKDGDEFLDHIVGIRGHETWGSLMNVETKEQSKQRVHTHSPNKPKKFKQTLSACQKAAGQLRSGDGRIHAIMDCSNIRSALRNIKKTSF
jgi:hypothetical protein